MLALPYLIGTMTTVIETRDLIRVVCLEATRTTLESPMEWVAVLVELLVRFESRLRPPRSPNVFNDHQLPGSTLCVAPLSWILPDSAKEITGDSDEPSNEHMALRTSPQAGFSPPTRALWTRCFFCTIPISTVSGLCGNHAVKTLAFQTAKTRSFPPTTCPSATSLTTLPSVGRAWNTL